jgi:hypothetical protein
MLYARSPRTAKRTPHLPFARGNRDDHDDQRLD